jgi:hypothetical protein
MPIYAPVVHNFKDMNEYFIIIIGCCDMNSEFFNKYKLIDECKIHNLSINFDECSFFHVNKKLINVREYVCVNMVSDCNKSDDTFMHNDKKYNYMGSGVCKFKSFDGTEMLFFNRMSSIIDLHGIFAKDGIVVSNNRESLDIFIDKIEDFSVCNNNFTTIYTLSMYSKSWIKTDNIVKRPLDSIYMSDGKKEFIKNDMQEYMANETKEFYKKHGISHKRIYLFHGSPGIGKTSIIRTLAGIFDKDVYIFNMTADMTDSVLINLFTNVKNNNFIVIEDIDTIVENKQISLSSLLNALDGISSSDMTIFITTNHLDKLPESLTRSGRVDVCIKFDNLNRCIFKSMTKSFYPEITDTQCNETYNNIRRCETNKILNICDIQNFYVKSRKSTLDDMIINSNKIFDIIETRASVANNSLYS